MWLNSSQISFCPKHNTRSQGGYKCFVHQVFAAVWLLSRRIKKVLAACGANRPWDYEVALELRLNGLSQLSPALSPSQVEMAVWQTQKPVRMAQMYTWMRSLVARDDRSPMYTGVSLSAWPSRVMAMPRRACTALIRSLSVRLAPRAAAWIAQTRTQWQALEMTANLSALATDWP